MSAPEEPKTFIVNSIIGEGSEFRGEFKIKGFLRIDGYFKGLIETSEKVLIGEKGFVESDIISDIVVVGGTVDGNVFAHRQVKLLSTGRVRGDIVAPSMFLEEGAVFEGRCTINKTGKKN